MLAYSLAISIRLSKEVYVPYAYTGEQFVFWGIYMGWSI